MATLNRRSLLSLLAAAGLGGAVLPLTGCPSGETTSNTSTTTPDGEGSPATNPTGKALKAGLVTDTGGINDKSFNAAAWDGLQRAQKELGYEVKYTESRTNADYASNLSRYAQSGYDVVFAVGVLMQDAFKEVAGRFPDVKFAIIDGEAPDLPNCVAYKFREEEGSFLVGALAGAMTKTNTVGFVGGMELPLIKKFEVGYKAGVQTTNPKAQVKVGYAGKFTDPAKGQEIALSQMAAGADILFHASGATGTGVIKAVAQKGPGFYAIGVDKDQDGEAPGRVLTSMIKRVDVAVFNVCKAVAMGDFAPGTTVLSLNEDALALSPMQYTKQDVPEDVMTRINRLETMLRAGEIKPPTTPEELATFQPPKL
ncbi:MAG: BMP family ABC transporter substrate-binding protein [Armatimonadaceae bacterium]